MGSFELVGTIGREDDQSCVVPVEKYVSSRTGMTLYVNKVSGPVVEGYFSLATEAWDDDGLPHTLEHMIFLGSHDYPYSGILDILANKVFAAGTNAWTAVDNTTYTISTAEKCGFLQILPIYLDHIFYPLLNESGFVTEVYHITGDAEDAGVVYSEMQSVETEDENVVERELAKLLYPDPECGYRYETGGVLHNLRTSCTHKKVIDYHKKMYKADNLAVVVAGQIDSQEIIQVLEKFESKILSKTKTEELRLGERPFTRPITPLSQSIERLVHYPSDQTTNGLVSIAWRGPNITDLKLIIALDLILYYLTDSSISPLYSHFISQKSYCNKIHYRVEEYRESYFSLIFTNTQLDALDKIRDDLMQILSQIVDQKLQFDTSRMDNIIKMKISEIHDKLEDSPHETMSMICIGDFLYGNPTNPSDFKTRFIQTRVFESVRQEPKDFWLSLIKRFMLDSCYALVIGKPCEELMKSIGNENKKRVEERKKTLGKKGLKDLKVKLENAIEQNDECEVPDEFYNSLEVPMPDKINFKQLKQFFSYKDNQEFEPFDKCFNRFQNLKHLQIQVDHLDATNFVQTYMIIDTSSLSDDLRSYLELYTNVMFELPVENGQVKLSHEQVVYELNKDLLEFDVSLGINGCEFEPGSFSQYLTVFTKTAVNDYELAIKWLKYITFDTLFDPKQITISINNLLKEINKRKTEPSDLISSLANDVFFKPNTNINANSFMKQEAFLNTLASRTESSDVTLKLNEIRSQLLRNQNIRFYFCADLAKLAHPVDSVWTKYFPASLLNSNKPFDVKPTSSLKKTHSTSKQDFVINLGSTESSYLRLVSSIDIDDYNHEDYAGLLVLVEYFTQTEGPLYEAVRGPGYAYHQSIHVSPEKGLIDLGLEKCANVTKAYEATRKLFAEHLDEDQFDENLFESAKNSLIFLLIDDLKSVSNSSSYSLSTFFKRVEIDAVQKLIKKIEMAKIEEMKILLEKYLMPLFDDCHSNCFVISHPSKSQHIADYFSEKFDRKLHLIAKADECFLN